MAQEGFIAASLIRNGWKVIYRATALEALREKLPHLANALILISDDFGTIEQNPSNRWIYLRGRSQSVENKSEIDPKSDFELEEIIRAHQSQALTLHIPATLSKVIAISSLASRSGATTFAIAIAEQLSQKGKSVLLVEGKQTFPRICFHFQAHNIREQITMTRFGFSILEVSDIQALHVLAQSADTFDFIVLDLGGANNAQPGGQRVEDLLNNWVINSRARIFLTARDCEQSRIDISRYTERIRSERSSLDYTLILSPTKILSKREQQRMMDEGSERYGIRVDIATRDQRALEKMESSHSTLALSSPKSPLVRDVARYLERERYS